MAEAEGIRSEACQTLKNAKAPKSKLRAPELEALMDVRVDKERVLLSADKGNASVVLDRVVYSKKMGYRLGDPA